MREQRVAAAPSVSSSEASSPTTFRGDWSCFGTCRLLCCSPSRPPACRPPHKRAQVALTFQNGLGYSPLKAGFAFLPRGVGVVITDQVTSRIIGRIGPRLPITIGALAVAGGLAWLSRISDHAAYLSDIFGPLVILSVGL